MATTTPTSCSDRVEEQVLLYAPLARVWRALTNADKLGAWFGVNLAGHTIAPGAHVIAHSTIPGYEHVVFDVTIDEMVPERRFAWRSHPHAVDPGVDYSAEARTLVTFTLGDAPDGGTTSSASLAAALPIESEQDLERPMDASRAEWLAARRALLAKEKEATRPMQWVRYRDRYTA